MGYLQTRFRFRERYFYLIVLPIAFTVEWWFAATQDWQAYPRSEWVALIDLCLFLPVVYFTFFGSKLPLKNRLIRSAGVAGLGLLAVCFIVPEANQFVIADLAHVRNALLIAIVLFEGFVLYKVIRAVYRRNADAKTLERDFAIPAWIARLMI